MEITIEYIFYCNFHKFTNEIFLKLEYSFFNTAHGVLTMKLEQERLCSMSYMCHVIYHVHCYTYLNNISVIAVHVKVSTEGQNQYRIEKKEVSQSIYCADSA